MRFETEGPVLKVSDIPELGAANASRFKDRVRAAFTEQQTSIEIDLGQTGFIDSCGLGALIALQKAARGRKGIVRLLHPQPPVQQMLKLTRMNQIFEISNS